MSTESTGKDVGIRRGSGHLMVNKTGRYGGGVCIESLEELATLNPLPTIIAILNDLTTKYNAHCADGTASHHLADTANAIAATTVTTEAEAYVKANLLKAAYNLHRVLITSDVHDNADATNVVASAAATTTATLVALTEELLVDYTAHCADATAHFDAEVVNVPTVAKYAGYTCTVAKFPANSYGLAVSTFVKEGGATTVNFDIGTASALTEYVTNALDTTGLAATHIPAAPILYTAEKAVVVTPDVTPTSLSERIYVQIHFIRFRALTGSPSA